MQTRVCSEKTPIFGHHIANSSQREDLAWLKACAGNPFKVDSPTLDAFYHPVGIGHLMAHAHQNAEIEKAFYQALGSWTVQ